MKQIKHHHHTPSDRQPAGEVSPHSAGKPFQPKSRCWKTLALALVALAATSLSVFAQIINLLPGFNQVGDPLLTAPTSLGTLLPNPGGQLDGTLVYLYQCSAGFTVYTLDSTMPTGWANVNDTIPVSPPVISPGEGFIIDNNTGVPYPWTITGSPGPPILPPTNYCGCGAWSLLCDQTTNASSTYQEVTGFAPQEGAQVSFEMPSNGVIIPDTSYANGAWSPNTPELTNGQAAFFYVPCTNNCFQVLCPTNKTVSCSGSWSYDLPTVNSCCGTNYSIATYGNDSVSNAGACSLSSTRTWLITDCSGQTYFCSQTVTVAPPTNYTLTLNPGYNLIANQLNHPGGNLANVLFPNSTGTLDGDELLFYGCGGGYTTDVFDSGSPSGFDDANYNPLTNAPVLAPGQGAFYVNNSGTPETVTFTGTPECPPPTSPLCPCGEESLVSYALDCPGTYQDITGLEPQPGVKIMRWNVASQSYTVNTFNHGTWSGGTPVLNVGEAAFILIPCTTNYFNVACPTNKTVNCGSLWAFDGPVASSSCTHLLSTGAGTWTNLLVTPIGLATNGACPRTITKTWLITDGCSNSTLCTQTVTVVNTNPPTLVCASNFTVSAGQPWSFTPPTASDACCSNLTMVVVSTVTNVSYNPCSINYTRTWQAIDCCSNTATCSQTVSLLSSGSCQIFNSGMSGVNGNVPVAAGAADPNFTLLSEPVGAGTSCVVAGTLPAAWPPNTSSSQWVGPAFNSQNSPPGLYHYRLQFLLCCTNNAHVTGRMAVDDGANLYLNGNAAGTVNGYSAWTPVNLSSGFVSGLNVLDIYVTNAIIWTGFRAELTNCASGLAVNCPANKNVECGTSWTFDQPTATSCCGGATVMLLSSVTNGVCPKYITNSWFIYDSCGNTDICSQAVTVIDTTPPAISCATNTLIVALNKNCQFVIPTVSVTATDNCTPLCSLVYSQSPTNGTIVWGTSAEVTVTVTDLCGNSSHCTVHLVGEDKTGPVITCPQTMTVTNCLVPCVPVTASDNCCPASSLVFAQSPPCGALAGPGVNSVTVTVTDCHGNVSTKVVHLNHNGSPQSFLQNLFNTGVGANRGLLPDAAEDSHYVLPPTAVPHGMPADYFGYAVAVSDVCHSAAPVPDTCHYAYLTGNDCYHYVPWALPPDAAIAGSGAMSKWIGPDYTNNSCCPAGTNGTYTYTQTFQLPTDLDPSTAWLSGRGAADNSAWVYVNGNYIGSLTLSGWSTFQSTPGMIKAGNNTLSFVLYNASHWTGLRVEITNAVANCATCAPPTIKSITSSSSVPVGSSPLLSVTAGGSGPDSYQWQFNSANIPGANGATLQLHSLGYASAGIYSVIIANPCGVVTGHLRLSVYRPYWTNALWNVTSLALPLAATYGPDLLLTGPSVATNYAISSGTTEDFGLPEVGGQMANVMAINPQAGASIVLPPVVPAGGSAVDSYTVIMDLYQPSNSVGTPTTLFQNQSAPGGLSLSLDASNYVHIAGVANGVPFDTASANPMPPATWNRLALVVAGPTLGLGGSAIAYLNGMNDVLAYSCPCCTFETAYSVNWSNSSPTVLGSVTNATAVNGEFYLSSLQFHALAMPPEMIAGLDAPDTGPTPGSDISAPAVPPVLASAAANGILNLSWTGSSYVLQETTDLGSDIWAESSLPFTETLVNDSIVNSTSVNPATEGPAKFYRLAFRP